MAIDLNLSMEKVIVDSLPVTVSLRLREEYPAVAHHMQVARYHQHDSEYVTYVFHSFLSNIHKEDKLETTLFKYPATVWQYFKLKYTPKWFLKRFPETGHARPNEGT